MEALKKTKRYCNFIQKITLYLASYFLYEIVMTLCGLEEYTLSDYFQFNECFAEISPQATSSLCEIGFGLNLAVNLLNQAQTKLSDSLKTLTYQWWVIIAEKIEARAGLFDDTHVQEPLTINLLSSIQKIIDETQDEIPKVLTGIELNLIKQCFLSSTYLLIISFFIAGTAEDAVSLLMLLQISYIIVAAFVAFILNGLLCYAGCAGAIVWFILRFLSHKWLSKAMSSIGNSFK